MENKDETLEVNPGEQEQELELENSQPENTDDNSQGTIDEIDDPAELRKRLKNLEGASTRYRKERDEERQERQRLEGRLKDLDTPKEEKPEKPADTSDGFLTKKDFYKANERKAINALTKEIENDPEEVKQRKSLIADNWEAIRQFYTPRHGKETPEDISEDLNDAVTLWQAKNPPRQDDDSAKELQVTTGKGTGGKETPKPSQKEPPRFKIPVQPNEWYKKSEK